ncbi:MAG TPA: DUF1501 domain-containing protein [Sandaracinaceae bacterium LLY-WYZ-13_1]|nr:DUF1501 domain-containing protein [Sandaracinaceae bacterium LLY-WYZ-13_1]
MLTRSRRGWLASLAGPANRPTAAPAVVVVFLRGGADGLSLVPPLGDPDYRRRRPTLGIDPADAIDLDGFFALHPALGPLTESYRAGELAVVHAVGSDDRTRSHFEAQDRMEHASPRLGSGWLARLARAGGSSGALSAVALGTERPEALRGAPAVSVLERADEHRIGAEDDPAWLDALAALHRGPGPVRAAGRDALSTLARLRDLPAARTAEGYPDGDFGRRLRELARLLRAGLVRVACVDLDGWDTHFVQADALAERARALADGLRAFRADLRRDPTAWRRVTVLVVTEFGRRAYENGSAGTDHGRGSVMLALGPRVNGGRVYARWPGLSDGALEPPGDLAVTTDHRQVLAELVETCFPDVDREAVLPGAPAGRLGVFAGRA